MKHLFMILAIGAILVGCKEKTITIKEFKENNTLRAEWLKKCKDESGFEKGSCRNAYEADKSIRLLKQVEESRKARKARNATQNQAN